MNSNLNKYEQFLIDEITYVDCMFDLYVYIYNKKIDKLEELNMAPGFFRLVLMAFRDNSIMRLSKLLELDNNSINIRKYLNIIEQEKEEIYGITELKEVTKNIALHNQELIIKNDDLNKLRKIRDKSLAHNDLHYIRNSSDIWKDVDLKICEINELNKWVFELINTYKVLRGEPSTVLELIDKYDVDYVFSALTEYLQNNYSIDD